METAIHKVGLFILCIFLFTIFACVASGSCTEKYELFSIRTLWRGVRLMLQPYFRVHYGALPPV